MNVEINKRYCNITQRGSDGIDRVNVNVTEYYYEVKFNAYYFNYDNLEELKQNIENDIKKLQNEINTKILKKVK